MKALTNSGKIYCPNFSKYIHPTNGGCLVNLNSLRPKICCGRTNWGVGATKAVSWGSSGVGSEGFQGVNRRVQCTSTVKYGFVRVCHIVLHLQWINWRVPCRNVWCHVVLYWVVVSRGFQGYQESPIQKSMVFLEAV